jgi:CDP-glycerol glycerophosphotransferase (TagB/SpsB family)
MKALENASVVLRQSLIMRWRARQRIIRRKYGNAWVLVDRFRHADDSAEHLFRYLREFRSDVNAWFVLEAGTPDWDRLVKEGYSDRMVAYKTTEWTLLMLNCEVVVSSHADRPIQSPRVIRRQFGKRTWRFVFLQPGIGKDDVSNWLNPKSLDLFIVSTRNEYASIAGEDTTYRYSTKETKLTELPRFDKLRQRSQDYPPAQRDLVLVAPAWRNWLTMPLEEGSQRREVSRAFLTSDYARNWIAFLESDELVASVRDRNLRIAILPHPKLAAVIDKLNLPDYVLKVGSQGPDVRSYLARSALVVTDYSSMAFDAAYLERPLVYFQFDAELMFGGRQADSQGYFDYQEQGFGPVADDLAGAIGSACSAIAYGPTPSSHYLERVQQSFPYRDGRASERVANEISALLTPGGSMADGHLNEPPVPASFVSRTLPADPAAKATRFR